MAIRAHNEKCTQAAASRSPARTSISVRHRGKIVTVTIEDTHVRVLHGEEEITVHPRRNLKPISRFHVSGAGANHKMRQASLDDNPSRMS